MDQISFQGNFIKKVNIQKLTSKGKYKPVRANFIELDHDDLSAIRQVSAEWHTAKINAMFSITKNFILPPDIMKKQMEKHMHLTKGMNKADIPAFLSSKIKGTHIYAVTTQKHSFDKINPKKILGFAEFNAEERFNEIATLQTKPNCVSENYGNQTLLLLKRGICKLLGIKEKKPKQPYKNIGSSIVNTLKQMYNDKPMELIPADKARSFYRKYGFDMDPNCIYRYSWCPRNVKQIN